MAAAEVSPDVAAKAEELKAQGNDAFKAKHFDEAIRLYGEAIETNPNVPAYYANRAFAYIKEEFYGAALEDASKAIEIDSSFVKAYYRRATANMALCKFKESLKDFKMVVKVAPADRDAQLKLKACEKIVKEQAFAKAIAVDIVMKSAFDDIEWQSIALPTEYDGYKFPEGEEVVNKEFVADMIERFKNQKLIARRYAYMLLTMARDHFKALPSLVDVPKKEGVQFNICGDTHGQFYDLMNIFSIKGLPTEENAYLFNGDFVDRGSFSVEVIFTLLAFKLLYPDNFHLTRGNHESENMNKMYGFDGEVKAKFNQKMAEVFHEVFRLMPLAYCIDGKVLVVHGGLSSEDDVTLDDIRKIDRNREPPEGGLMSDLLWADPQDAPGRGASKRGIGLQFGPDVTAKFLEDNGLKYLVRSHEVKDEGYEVAHDGKCITIFSAPNYCDQMGNKGAIITLGPECEPEFTQFEAVPHPDIKPMAYANQFGMFGM
eukprot:Clim_evm65s210 gene=Clim_evmTU65s210